MRTAADRGTNLRDEYIIQNRIGLAKPTQDTNPAGEFVNK